MRTLSPGVLPLSSLAGYLPGSGKVVIHLVMRVRIGGAAGRPLVLPLAARRRAGLQGGAGAVVLLSGPAGSELISCAYEVGVAGGGLAVG
jgi:hypothetical protein